MKNLLMALYCMPLAALACPEALRYADPCETVVLSSQAVSVYEDAHKCVQPLLYDGVCPDYLVGNCAALHTCQTIERLNDIKKPVLFSDDNS